MYVIVIKFKKTIHMHLYKHFTSKKMIIIFFFNVISAFIADFLHTVPIHVNFIKFFFSSVQYSKKKKKIISYHLRYQFPRFYKLVLLAVSFNIILKNIFLKIILNLFFFCRKIKMKFFLIFAFISIASLSEGCRFPPRPVQQIFCQNDYAVLIRILSKTIEADPQYARYDIDIRRVYKVC